MKEGGDVLVYFFLHSKGRACVDNERVRRVKRQAAHELGYAKSCDPTPGHLIYNHFSLTLEAQLFY